MKDPFKRNKQKNKKTLKGPKRISKKEKREEEQNDAFSEESGDFFEENLERSASDEFEEEKETANEKRLRIAKEIIKKKRKLMQERKLSEESQEVEDSKGDYIFQTKINLVKRNKFENIDHIFGLKDNTEQNEKVDTKVSKDINDKQLEKEFQKEIYEKENRVIYPLFSSVKTVLESKKTLPFISLNAHKRPITFCRFDPITNDLITVSKDSAILRHTFASSYKKKHLISAGFPKDENGHKDEVLTCDVSFDGQYLVTAGKDRIIKLWNLRKAVSEKKEKKEVTWMWDFKGHRADITAVRFKENSLDFVSLSEDRALKVWDSSRRAFMENLYGHASDPVWLERLGNNFMVSVGYDKTPILWKIEQEKIVKFHKQLFSLGTEVVCLT